jgi:hypothetical protein
VTSSGTTWCPRSSSRPTGASGLRPLLPAAQGEHHLPGHADRRHDRQPGLRPAAAPRVGEPRQGHQHLHQQPRRRHHRRCSPSTTRCSSSSPTSPRSASARRPRRPRCCWRPAPRASAWRCPTPGSSSTSPTAGPGPGHRHRDRGQGDPAACGPARGDPRHHTGQPIEKIHTDTDRDFVMTAEEAKEYGIIDEVISARNASTTPVRSSSGKRSRRAEGGRRGQVR